MVFHLFRSSSVSKPHALPISFSVDGSFLATNFSAECNLQPRNLLSKVCGLLESCFFQEKFELWKGFLVAITFKAFLLPRLHSETIIFSLSWPLMQPLRCGETITLYSSYFKALQYQRKKTASYRRHYNLESICDRI